MQQQEAHCFGCAATDPQHPDADVPHPADDDEQHQEQEQLFCLPPDCRQLLMSHLDRQSRAAYRLACKRACADVWSACSTLTWSPWAFVAFGSGAKLEKVAAVSRCSSRGRAKVGGSGGGLAGTPGEAVGASRGCHRSQQQQRWCGANSGSVGGWWLLAVALVAATAAAAAESSRAVKLSLCCSCLRPQTPTLQPAAFLTPFPPPMPP